MENFSIAWWDSGLKGLKDVSTLSENYDSLSSGQSCLIEGEMIPILFSL